MENRSLILNSILILCGIIVGLLMALVMQGRPAQVVQPATDRLVRSVQFGNEDFEPPDGAELAVSLNNVFKEVAKKAVPAVVSINATLRQDRRRKGGLRGYGNGEYASAGSGVVISPEGYIVTNYHVVENSDDVSVTFSNNMILSAKMIGWDRNSDLAVLKVDPERTNLTTIDLGDSQNLEVGDWVIAIGNPFRLSSTVTTGIVSALDRPMDIFEANTELGVKDFIQTDAAINPGNSGGALLNLAGQLVGINTAIATETGVSQGAGFAVPVNLVSHVVNEIVANGKVRRGFLGVRVKDLRLDSRLARDNPGLRGAVVTEIGKNTPAMNAGLEVGDVIIKIGERDIYGTHHVHSSIALKSPGQNVKMGIIRGGLFKEMYIKLDPENSDAMLAWLEETYPEGVQEELIISLEDWGLGLTAMDRDDIRDFRVKKGAYIAYVDSGSQAALDAIPRDVVILSIDGQAVGDPEDVVRILELAFEMDAEELLFEVKKREGWNAFYDVTVPSLN